MSDRSSAAPSEVAVVVTTEGSRGHARALGHLLIERRLAACVTVSEVQSVYQWDGRVVEDDEVQLVIKVAPDRVADVTSTILETHSYDLPEVLVFSAGATPEYAAWVCRGLDQS